MSFGRFAIACLCAVTALSPMAGNAAHRHSHRGSGGGSYDSFVEGVVERDSQHWFMNRFDVGSVHGSYVKATSNDGRTVVVLASYTFNGGTSGQVGVVVTNGQFACSEYWDRPGVCRNYIPPEMLSWYDQPGPGSSGSGYQPQPYCGSSCQADIGRGRPQQ